jgi:hypothetical protein
MSSPTNSVADDLSEVQLQQMIFIYNAVMSGWTAKRISNGNFRFKKRHRTETERQVYTHDSFLQRFVQNMQRLETSREFASQTASAHVTTSLDEVSSFELPVDSAPPARRF